MRLEEIREIGGQRVDEFVHPLLSTFLLEMFFNSPGTRYRYIDYTTIYVNRRESRRERGPEEKERVGIFSQRDSHVGLGEAGASWPFLANREKLQRTHEGRSRKWKL